MTKKEGHQKFWRMKIGNFFGKGKILEIFLRILTFLENRGISETGEVHHGLTGEMDAPGYQNQSHAWKLI